MKSQLKGFFSKAGTTFHLCLIDTPALAAAVGAVRARRNRDLAASKTRGLLLLLPLLLQPLLYLWFLRAGGDDGGFGCVCGVI